MEVACPPNPGDKHEQEGSPGTNKLALISARCQKKGAGNHRERTGRGDDMRKEREGNDGVYSERQWIDRRKYR